VLKQYLEEDPRDYDVHVNFPGGVPVDGPSAGVAIAVAIYSAFTGRPVDNRTAMTGEVSIRGLIRPVGGVAAKVAAARQAGCTRVIIPRENWQEGFAHLPGVRVVPVERLDEVFALALDVQRDQPAAAVPADEPVPVPAFELPLPQPAVSLTGTER